MGCPMFSLKANVIQVRKGASVKILFIILFIITFKGHMFDMYTMVSEIHDTIDLVILSTQILCPIGSRNKYKRAKI